MLIKRDFLNHLKAMTATVIVFFHAVLLYEMNRYSPKWRNTRQLKDCLSTIKRHV